MNVPLGGGGGSGADSSECTALAAEVLEGKTAVTSDSNDNAIAGTMPNNGAVSTDLDCGNSFVIPAGFHDGSGIVTANSLASQTSGTASAADILSGQTAWVSGSQVTGSMTNRGAVTSSLNCGGSYTIPAGYHNGSGVVSANSLSSQTSGTAAAAQILSGYTAWVNGSQISGSMSDKSGSTTSVTATLDSSNSRVRMTIPNNGYYNTSAYLYSSYSSLASVVGLTAAKLGTGQSVLGITGTYKATIQTQHALAWRGFGYSTSDYVTDEEGSVTASGDGTCYYSGFATNYSSSSDFTCEIYKNNTLQDSRNGGEGYNIRATMTGKSFSVSAGDVIKLHASQTSGSYGTCFIAAVLVTYP